MKDEIKEILEFDFQNQGERIEINEYERNILKDYITNLQEELEGIKDNFKIQLEYDEELENKITNLKEENERLNEVIHYWEDKYENTKFTDNVYKSRNEKAIECIKDNLTREWGEYLYGYEDLLNILNGGSNE